jgi:hypothetical protein
MGSFSPKPPKILPGIGTSSLNKTMKNVSTVHAIFAQTSSIGAAWRKRLKNSTKSSKFTSKGHFFGKNAPNGDFKPKHPVE